MPREDVGFVKTMPVDATPTTEVFADLREGCGPEGAVETFGGTFRADPSNGPPATDYATWSCNWERYGNDTSFPELNGKLHC